MTSQPKNELPVGRIAGLFGLRGELKCDPTTAGRTVFSPGAQLRCEIQGRSEFVRLDTVREHKGRLLVSIHGFDDATAAQRFVGATFFSERANLDVGEGEYLDVDLIGCAIVSPEGRAYGDVSRVDHYPANDMLIVENRMIPMVKAFIVSIDIAAKRIVVDVPPGLLDDDSDEA